jgi:Leucine-rich repeat (LRR) protein
VELDLSFNQIQTLPKELGKLSRLQTALLAENNLIRLPRDIGMLASLTDLNLFSNKLTELPDELGELFALRRLSLSRNLVAALPDSLSRLSALETLDCACNLLQSLPEGNCCFCFQVSFSSRSSRFGGSQIADASECGVQCTELCALSGLLLLGAAGEKVFLLKFD